MWILHDEDGGRKVVAGDVSEVVMEVVRFEGVWGGGRRNRDCLRVQLI